jgi:hypothetical protein
MSLSQLSSTHLFNNNMDEFVLMRFSSTPHGLQIYAWPVGVDKNLPSNRQLYFQVSDQPVPMYSPPETEISSSTVKEEEKSDVETIYLSSDSELEEEPLENQKKRRMPPRRCKKDVRKKYRMDKNDEIDKLIEKSGRVAAPSKRKERIPYHKRYFAF